MIQIRKAKENDLEYIASFPLTPDELFFFYPKAVFPLTQEQLLANFLTRQGNTVIVQGDTIAGFANYVSVDLANSATIGNVIINPELRGSGLGKILISHMESSARTLYGVKRINIACFNSNTAGLIFYHKLGYVPYSGEKRINQRGEPVYLIFLSKYL